jgi:hypothetical protein
MSYGRIDLVTPRSVDRCVTTLWGEDRTQPHSPIYIQTIRDIGTVSKPGLKGYGPGTALHRSGTQIRPPCRKASGRLIANSEDAFVELASSPCGLSKISGWKFDKEPLAKDGSRRAASGSREDHLIISRCHSSAALSSLIKLLGSRSAWRQRTTALPLSDLRRRSKLSRR